MELSANETIRTMGHQHANGGGLKFTYCPHHPEHHLTVQNDIWATENAMISLYIAYAYDDIGGVDMNDYVEVAGEY